MRRGPALAARREVRDVGRDRVLRDVEVVARLRADDVELVAPGAVQDHALLVLAADLAPFQARGEEVALDGPRRIPPLVAVDASALPQTPEEVAALRPDKRIAVSFGCEERCAVPSRTEDVTLGRFVEKLRGDPKAGYLKQCPLEDLGCRWSLRAHAPFLTSWVQETAFLWVGGRSAALR